MRSAKPATKAERAARAASFAIRHAIGSAVVSAGVLLLVLLSWFALFLWAIVAGEPLGGPLALPLMLLIGLVASVATVLACFVVTAIAELLCTRLLRWPWVAQIPVSVALLVLLVLGGSLLLALGAVERDVPGAALVGLLATCVLLLPLGAYFWSMRSAGWLLAALGSVLRRT